MWRLLKKCCIERKKEKRKTKNKFFEELKSDVSKIGIIKWVETAKKS